ncbi:hypothetical protein [Paraburkholderia hospita]|nr:hypothetical protein [Paraburkholderia hospita]
MNRVHCDNALLAACDQTYSTIIVGLKAVALFVGIGAAWYVGVAIRAGAF